jgi:hypothetical protein
MSNDTAAFSYTTANTGFINATQNAAILLFREQNCSMSPLA